MMHKLVRAALAALFAATALSAWAQVPVYGNAVSLEQARKMLAAGQAEGGLPLVVEGKIIGAIGVSGVNGDQDAVVAKAGADATK